VPCEPDDVLIQRTQVGDLTAFGTIVDRYRTRIYNLAYRMLGDRDRADDVAQEVFIRVYKALGTYRMCGTFSTWLFAIAVNVCTDALRQKPVATTPIDSSEGGPAHESGGTDPHSAYQRSEMQERIQNAMGRLPDQQRLIIALIHLQGHSYEEVAQIMRQPIGTVKSHAHRARARLKTLLAPCMEEDTR